MVDLAHDLRNHPQRQYISSGFESVNDVTASFPRRVVARCSRPSRPKTTATASLSWLHGLDVHCCPVAWARKHRGASFPRNAKRSHIREPEPSHRIPDNSSNSPSPHSLFGLMDKIRQRKMPLDIGRQLLSNKMSRDGHSWAVRTGQPRGAGP